MTYVTQTPQTTDSTREVQGACYNQLVTTLYTPAACQQCRKQHHTRAVVCPRCVTAVPSYLIAAFVIVDPAICRPAGLCCCVIHACCRRYYNTDISYSRNMISYAYDTISHAVCFSIRSCATLLGTSRRGTVPICILVYLEDEESGRTLGVLLMSLGRKNGIV